MVDEEPERAGLEAALIGEFSRYTGMETDYRLSGVASKLAGGLGVMDWFVLKAWLRQRLEHLYITGRLTDRPVADFGPASQTFANRQLMDLRAEHAKRRRKPK